jgi:UDP-3-O-[3-hydroxymyristoyl] N-acetylglucosamine deacetylase
MTLRPADPDQGIVFRRTDLAQVVDIRATAENVGDTMLGTTLGRGESRVSTVEHLLSAFAGLGIDNAIVEVSAAEVPIMDGSGGPFVFMLQSAGIEEQRRPALHPREEALAGRGRRQWAQFDPFDGFVNFEIEFNHPIAAARSAPMDFDHLL